MAIRIGNIGVPKKNGYTFSDIHLDIETTSPGIGGNSIRLTTGKDIVIDKDLEAIRNSVTNILSTFHGQRPLNPDFGTNLLGFLGSPVDDITSNMIGQEILRSIRIWEPRVKILNVIVRPLPDQNSYDIMVIIDVPSLDTKTTLVGSLNGMRGFTISRND